MALMTCPDCGNSVSSFARACPHCGRPMLSHSARIVVYVVVAIALFTFSPPDKDFIITSLWLFFAGAWIWGWEKAGYVLLGILPGVTFLVTLFVGYVVVDYYSVGEEIGTLCDLPRGWGAAFTGWCGPLWRYADITVFLIAVILAAILRAPLKIAVQRKNKEEVPPRAADKS